jgi:flagellar motor protein MotB
MSIQRPPDRHQEDQEGGWWRPPRRRVEGGYADFVTAMIAFFLLMADQPPIRNRRGIADISAPRYLFRHPVRVASWAGRRWA